MSNLLFCASYVNYFNVSSKRGIELICALILLGILLTIGIIIYFKSKELMKKYIVISIFIFLLFAISIFIANIILDAKDGAYKIENMDLHSWLENLDFLYVAIIFTIILSIILILTPILLDKEHTITKMDTKSLAYAGICLALSFGLSYIRLFKGPYGGSITLASLLPIALYSYIFGSKKGLIIGLSSGVLQFIQDPYFYHILQFLLDYIIPFGFIGMCGGLFRKYIKPQFALSLGIIVGVIFRFIAHFISGAVFFGVWGLDSFSNIWIYSFVYNISYVLPDGVICVVLAFILFRSKQFENQINLISLNKQKIKDDEI